MNWRNAISTIKNGHDATKTGIGASSCANSTARKLGEEALLKAGAQQRAIFNSANFSSIATDASRKWVGELSDCLDRAKIISN